MAASKHVCAPIMELSKAARFHPCCSPCTSMTWTAWQKNVQGDFTGTRDVRVTHKLYADDLCFTSNFPDQLQLMLDSLHTYAQRKGLVINTAKFEIVHFNSKGDNVP
eukprot:282580-Pelagomonas_calceolata.AAC.1